MTHLEDKMCPPYVGALAQQIGSLYNTFFSLQGKGTYSDEFLGRILAFGEMSGWPEPFVLNHMLNAVTQVAQRRYMIYGGGRPNIELLRAYFYPACVQLCKEQSDCAWAKEIAERYNMVKWEKLPFRESFQATMIPPPAWANVPKPPKRSSLSLA
jgi:hypothetical protein